MILTERGAIVNTFFPIAKNFFKGRICGAGTGPHDGRRRMKREKGADGRTGKLTQLPLADSQEEPAAAYCRYCRGEIYEGEEYYCVDGGAICGDCLDALARDCFRLYRVNGGT